MLSHALDNEEFDGLADPKLGKDYVESEMFRMIEAAAACVRHLASKRPRMGQVMNYYFHNHLKILLLYVLFKF